MAISVGQSLHDKYLMHRTGKVVCETTDRPSAIHFGRDLFVGKVENVPKLTRSAVPAWLVLNCLPHLLTRGLIMDYGAAGAFEGSNEQIIFVIVEIPVTERIGCS